MSFAGLPGIVAEMQKLDSASKLTAEDLKKVAEAAIKAVTEGEKAVAEGKKVREAEAAKKPKPLEQGEWREIGPGVSEAGGYQWMPWGELTKPEDQAGRTDPTKSAAYTKLLEDLVARIKAVMGPDNYIAQLLEKELPYLKNGARSAGEVQNFVQGVMMNLFAGLRDQLADPRTPKEVRALLLELMGLAMDARNIVEGGQRDSADLRRADAERKRQDEIRDLLATDRHNKTKAQLDELDKKIRELQGRQDETGAAVNRVGEHVMSGITQGHNYGEKTIGAISQLSGGLTKSGQAVQDSINRVGEHTMNASVATGKLAQAAADQKAANKALLYELNSRADDLKKQMKEAADQEKKDAEEARKHLSQVGNDLLRGMAATSGGQSQLISDHLERRVLGLGG